MARFFRDFLKVYLKYILTQSQSQTAVSYVIALRVVKVCYKWENMRKCTVSYESVPNTFVLYVEKMCQKLEKKNVKS
jgi:hypothetical protein